MDGLDGFDYVKRRPPLYWKSLWMTVPFLVISSLVLVVQGLAWLIVPFVAIALAFIFVPWFLSPYSRAARFLAWPTDDDLDRSLRVADRIGAVPVFGVVWRFFERLSGNQGRKRVEDYRRWRHEHDDEWPT